MFYQLHWQEGPTILPPIYVLSGLNLSLGAAMADWL
jgi:hypothetical protein